MKFYVYELVDPRDESVFYVGKGKAGRIDQHEVEARKGRQSRKCERIREIEAAGFAIVKRKASRHADEAEAYDAEADLICQYGLDALTNVVPGGRGGRGRGLTIYEDRRLVVEATKLVRRIHGKNITTLNVLGREIDFSWVPEHIDRAIERVAKRRTWGWVNQIASRYKVTYSIEGAA